MASLKLFTPLSAAQKSFPLNLPEGLVWDEYVSNGNIEDLLSESPESKLKAVKETVHYPSSPEITHWPFDARVATIGDVLEGIRFARTPTEMRVGMIRLFQHTLNGCSDNRIGRSDAQQVLQAVSLFLAQYFTQRINKNRVLQELDPLYRGPLSNVNTKEAEYGFLGTPGFVANAIARTLEYFLDNPRPDTIVGCANSGTEFAMTLGLLLGIPVKIKKTTRIELSDSWAGGVFVKGRKVCTDGIEIDLPIDGIYPNIQGSNTMVVDTQVATGTTMEFALSWAYRKGAADAYGTTVNERVPRYGQVVKIDCSIPLYRLANKLNQNSRVFSDNTKSL